MADGTDSTLIIHPAGLSDVTMLLGAGASGYIVPLQTVDFNEELRWRLVYGQAPPGEGGRPLDSYAGLVPITFQVVIKNPTRAGMINDYHTLQAALRNHFGGTVEYKPDGVGAGVMSTYFHYVSSLSPRVLDTAGNRWDAAPGADAMYTLAVEVEFQTQPIATSDPDTPTQIITNQNIENWVDNSPAQVNYIAVSSSVLKGTLPCLVRLVATVGTGQELGRLIVYRRSEGTLANFISIYEAEDADVVSGSWADDTDAARGDGGYAKLVLTSPAYNGYAHGLSFTIANPEDHKGRFAVFGVGYTDSAGWTHQVKLKSSNAVQSGAANYTTPFLGSWCLIYAGEFVLPPGQMSSIEEDYQSDPKIEWLSTRNEGAGNFFLDAIVLVYVADSELQPSAIDVPLYTDDDGAISGSEKLLIENFPDDYGQIHGLAHVLASDNDLKRIPDLAPRGDFITLEPTKAHRLIFIQEQGRPALLTVEDDFQTGYEGVTWLEIVTVDDETWDNEDSTHQVEGSYCQDIAGTGGLVEDWSSIIDTVDVLNNGAFTELDDFIVVARVLSGAHAELEVLLEDTAEWSIGYEVSSVPYCALSDPEAGFNPEVDITLTHQVGYYQNASVGAHSYVDQVSIQVADPDAPSYPNATGRAWDVDTGHAGWWGLTKDCGGDSYAIHLATFQENDTIVLTKDVTTPNDVYLRGRVRVNKDDGYAGIAWRIQDETGGSEDCYCACIDTASNQIRVYEYAAGSQSLKSGWAFTCAVDTWYVLGVRVDGDTFTVFGAKLSELPDGDDSQVFNGEYEKGSAADATKATGQCGFISIDSLGRFDNFYFESYVDRMIPSDDITVNGYALFRTIAPFSE